MNIKITTKILIISIILIIIACGGITSKRTVDFLQLSGPYLGQTPPGNIPEVFAPDLISTSLYTRDITMTPDGNEIYFCVSALNYNVIYYTKQVNGSWTEPVLAPFIKNLDYIYYEPHITPDGSKMLFLSNMPTLRKNDTSQNIWVVERQGNGWGEPYDIGEPINTQGDEYFPSVTKDGTIYYTHGDKDDRLNYIYRSKFIDGKYSEPEKLNDKVNSGTNRYNAFIDPDERFIIVCVVDGKNSYGGTDYYIVFRDESDNWSDPVNLGPEVNQARGAEWSPYISPDGKYLFFMSSRTDENLVDKNSLPTLNELVEASSKSGNGTPNIYWVNSDFLMEMKPE